MSSATRSGFTEHLALVGLLLYMLFPLLLFLLLGLSAFLYTYLEHGPTLFSFITKCGPVLLVEPKVLTVILVLSGSHLIGLVIILLSLCVFKVRCSWFYVAMWVVIISWFLSGPIYMVLAVGVAVYIWKRKAEFVQ